MAILSKFIEGLLLNGGILAAGLICLIMAKSEYIPRAANPITYSAATVGIAGGAAGLVYRFSDRFLGGREEETELDPDHEARMEEFERIKPMLEEYILEQQRLYRECEIAKNRWGFLDQIEALSNLYEVIIVDFEARAAKNPEVLQALVRRTTGRRKHPSDEDNRRMVRERRREFERFREWTPRGASLERSGGDFK